MQIHLPFAILLISDVLLEEFNLRRIEVQAHLLGSCHEVGY